MVHFLAANWYTFKLQYTGDNGNQVKIHRFERIWAGRVRILIDQFDNTPSIAEFEIYNHCCPVKIKNYFSSL